MTEGQDRGNAISLSDAEASPAAAVNREAVIDEGGLDLLNKQSDSVVKSRTASIESGADLGDHPVVTRPASADTMVAMQHESGSMPSASPSNVVDLLDNQPESASKSEPAAVDDARPTNKQAADSVSRSSAPAAEGQRDDTGAGLHGRVAEQEKAKTDESAIETDRSVLAKVVREAASPVSPQKVDTDDRAIQAATIRAASSPQSRQSIDSSTSLLSPQHAHQLNRSDRHQSHHSTESSRKRRVRVEDEDASGAGSATRDIRKPVRPPQLPHLTGVRTLIAMWIVVHHMAPLSTPASSVSTFTMRVDIAVELFMILSGFMYHYNYGDEDFITSSGGSLLSFYVRRLTRIVLTTHVNMFICLFWEWYGGKAIFTLNNLGCLLFIRNWIDPTPDCPNSPTWFIAATIPSWLIYPLLTRRLLHAVNSLSGLLKLCCGLWVFALGPQLLLIIFQGHWLTWQQVAITWFWPGAQVADFALGCGIAALVRYKPPDVIFSHFSRRGLELELEMVEEGEVSVAGKKMEWLVPLIADLVFLFGFLVIFFVPVAKEPDGWTGPRERPGHFMAWDALFARLSVPWLSLWIYCSSSKVGADSVSARFFSHPILVGLGAYTLDVYLMQTPLHDVFTWTRSTLFLTEDSVEVFMLYVFLLWFLSIAMVDLVVAPADKWLRMKTEDWTNRRALDILQDTASDASATLKAKYSVISNSEQVGDV